MSVSLFTDLVDSEIFFTFLGGKVAASASVEEEARTLSRGRSNELGSRPMG